MKYRSIILLGPPGSGKGTQGKALGTLPEFFHCSCGEVFRSINPQTDLGRVFSDYSSRGQLVPDEVTVSLWRDYLADCEYKRRFQSARQCLILDGIPRNARQAKLLESFIEVQAIFHLRCGSTDELVTRIQRRALQENRNDDARTEVIRRRMEVYESESLPVLDHYASSRIFTIDALQAPAMIQEHIAAGYRESQPTVAITQPRIAFS